MALISKTFLTELGPMRIEVCDEMLTRLYLPGYVPAKKSPDGDNALLSEAGKQLFEYLAGKRCEFDLPLSPGGTAFQKQIWRELCRIPYGECISYGELARRIGKPGAARAVGQANHHNPLPIFIPCHRVIAAGGALGGYAGGLPLKMQLLQLETRART